jgi:hypothetical protein
MREMAHRFRCTYHHLLFSDNRIWGNKEPLLLLALCQKAFVGAPIKAFL